MPDYVAPKLGEDGFNCPHCGAYAHQETFEDVYKSQNALRGRPEELEGFSVTHCVRCDADAIWLNESKALLYPAGSTAPLPSTDMPKDVARDYSEARDVLARSPRAAAALLRLAIQQLVRDLGKPGKNLNEDIAALVKDGLPARIQKALDIVRVIGNNAVHPGEIDLRDDAATAGQMFVLVNLIVDAMITQPRAVEALFEALPSGAKDAIAKRDTPAS